MLRYQGLRHILGDKAIFAPRRRLSAIFKVESEMPHDIPKTPTLYHSRYFVREILTSACSYRYCGE
jgi:hypothetical protein